MFNKTSCSAQVATLTHHQITSGPGTIRVQTCVRYTVKAVAYVWNETFILGTKSLIRRTEDLWLLFSCLSAVATPKRRCFADIRAGQTTLRYASTDNRIAGVDTNQRVFPKSRSPVAGVGRSLFFRVHRKTNEIPVILRHSVSKSAEF